MTEEPHPPKRRYVAFFVFAWEMLRAFVAVVRRPAEAAIVAPYEPPIEGDRANDTNCDLKEDVDLRRRRRWGTVIVVLLLLLTAAAGVELQWIYWTDSANNLLLGGSLAVCLITFGAALVFHAHWLMIHKEATDPREVLPSSAEMREETYDSFTRGKMEVERRGLLTWLLFAGVASMAAAFVSYFRSLGTPPGATLFDTIWKRGKRLVTVDNKPMSLDSLQPGEFAVVFPEDQVGSEHAQTVLIRVDDRLLRLPPERSDWAPSGYLAYSRVCTHAGCVVGLYEKTVEQLLCPCHQSTFDVLRAACPTGGPADRALPQLPLYVDGDGTLRAAGGFSSPPGPGFWGLPS